MSLINSSSAINSRTLPVDTSDILRAGLLKYKRSKSTKERYFVLRSELRDAASPNLILKPYRLEYYESEKKFRNGSPCKASITLNDCFNISRKHGGKDDHMLTIFTKKDAYTIYFEDEKHLKDWLNLLLDLTESIVNSSKYERVWQVTIPKNQTIKRENLIGTYRLCLTNDKKLHLVKVVMNDTDVPVTHELPLSCIRRFSHNKKYFIIELGRSAPLGAGDICMLTDDGATTHDMHEAILRTIDHQPSSASTPSSGIIQVSTSSSVSTISSMTAANHHHHHHPHHYDSETASRPRSASTSESCRPISFSSGRRTSRDNIIPISNTQAIPIGSASYTVSSVAGSGGGSCSGHNSGHSSASHSLNSPGLYYTTISIRERCDSLPSNYRSVNGKGKPPVCYRDTSGGSSSGGFGSTRSMSNSSGGVNGRLSSSSPPSNNPLSPSCCSTDSIGSSFSEDYDAHHLANGTDYYVTTTHSSRGESSTTVLPCQSPIREEENPQEGSDNFVLIKFSSQSRKTSLGSGPNTPLTSQQQLRSSLNLMLKDINQTPTSSMALVSSSMTPTAATATAVASATSTCLSSSPSSCSSSFLPSNLRVSSAHCCSTIDDHSLTNDGITYELNGDDYVPMFNGSLSSAEALKRNEKTTSSPLTHASVTTSTGLPETPNNGSTATVTAASSTFNKLSSFSSPSTTVSTSTITSSTTQTAATVSDCLDDDSYVPMAPISQQNNSAKKTSISLSSASITTGGSSSSSNQTTPPAPPVSVHNVTPMIDGQISEASTLTANTTTTSTSSLTTSSNSNIEANVSSEDQQNEDEYFDLMEAMKQIKCREEQNAAPSLFQAEASTSTAQTTAVVASTVSESVSSASTTDLQSTSESNVSLNAASKKQFHLDEVNCYIFQDEEEEDSLDYVKLVRAYSTGSKPPTTVLQGRALFKSHRSHTLSNQKAHTRERPIQSYNVNTAKCDSNIRVRSFSMGSQNVGVKRTFNPRK